MRKEWCSRRITSDLRVLQRRQIVPFGAAVFHPVGCPDGEMLLVIKNKRGGHVIRDKADFDLHADELHRDVIADAVDLDCRVLRTLRLTRLRKHSSSHVVEGTGLAWSAVA